MEIIDRLSAGDPEKKKYYIRLFLDTLSLNWAICVHGCQRQPEPIRVHSAQAQEPGADHRSGRCARHDGAHEQTIKGGGRIDQAGLDKTCALLSTLIQNLQDLLK